MDLGGHLASIHTPGEYMALEAATMASGVTDSVFIGGYDDECHMGTMGADGTNDLCAAAARLRTQNRRAGRAGRKGAWRHSRP